MWSNQKRGNFFVWSRCWDFARTAGSFTNPGRSERLVAWESHRQTSTSWTKHQQALLSVFTRTASAVFQKLSEVPTNNLQKTTVVLRWGHTFNCKHLYRMKFAVSFLNYSKAFLTKSSSGGRRIAMACYDIAPSSFYLTLPLRSSLLLNLKSKPLCCPSASRNHLYQIKLCSSPSTRLACPPHG